MKHFPDVDLDFGSRDDALKLFKHHPATIIKDGVHRKHTTGVYPTEIPTDPRTGLSTLDHKVADDRGYFKLDFLNVHVYENVRDEAHLDELIKREPNWERLWTDEEFCEKVIHVNNYYKLLGEMKPDTIPRMAMFISVIRPAKAHLRDKSWKEISETVWEKSEDGKYGFKHAHAISYSVLVQVHMNLLEEMESKHEA